jgi:ATP-dependent Clp protease ATP-binding subunit ClpA
MKIKVLTVLDQQCPRFAISLSSRPKTLTKKKKKKKNQTKRKKKRTSRRRVEERQHAKKKDKTNERTYIRFVMNDAPMVEGWSSE